MNKFLFAMIFIVLCMHVFAGEQDSNSAPNAGFTSVAFFQTELPENVGESCLVTVILVNESDRIISVSQDIEALNVSNDGIPVTHLDYASNRISFIDISPSQALKITFLLKKDKLRMTQGKQTDIVIRLLNRITKKESTESIRIKIHELVTDAKSNK